MYAIVPLCVMNSLYYRMLYACSKLTGYHLFIIFLCSLFESLELITKLPEHALHILNISNVRIVITSSCETFSYRGNNPLCLSTAFVLNIYSNGTTMCQKTHRSQFRITHTTKPISPSKV